MAPKTEYVSEEDLTEAEIEAGLQLGTLEKWRTDADGTVWYARKDGPEMRGIPNKSVHPE